MRVCVVAICLVWATGCDCLQSIRGDGETSSRQAFEQWASFHPQWARRGKGFSTPQTLGASRLFNKAEAIESDGVEDALLLCSIVVEVGRRWDALGRAPDLAATLEVGDGFGRMATLGTSGHEAILSWPLVTLSRGDALELRVVDIDLSRHDFIGAQTLVWAGNIPIKLADGPFAAECRALPRPSWEAELPRRVTFSEKMLESYEKALRPEIGPEGWRYPETEEREVKRYLEDVAGYAGWGDKRVRPLLERYEVLKAKHRDVVRRAVDEKCLTLPAAGTPVAISPHIQVTVVDTGCDPRRKDVLAGRKATGLLYAERPCYVVLKVTNASTEEHRWPLSSFEPLFGLKLIEPSGRPKALDPFGAMTQDGTVIERFSSSESSSTDVVLRPAESARIAVAHRTGRISLDAPVGERPRLIMVGLEEPVFLRLD